MRDPASSNVDALVTDLRANPRQERLLAEGSTGVAVTLAFTRLRTDAGISRAELGRRIGRTQAYVKQLESGAYERCTLPALRSFARALGHDVDVQTMLSRIAAPVYSYDVGVDAVLDYELQAATEDASSGEDGTEAPLREIVYTRATNEADDANATPTFYEQILELGALTAKKLIMDAPKARER